MFSLILLCAGSGTRSGLGYNKMLYKIKDETLYEKTLRIFLSNDKIKEIIIVCKKDEIGVFENLIIDNRLKFVVGGQERQDSVYNGLLVAENEYVLIHDGARPYCSKELVESIMNCVVLEKACAPMVPSIDTIKVVENGYVKETPNRSSLMTVQTPQAFETSLIKGAYNLAIKSKKTFTDDCSIIEVFCRNKVAVVLGEYSNIKITNKEDLL